MLLIGRLQTALGKTVRFVYYISLVAAVQWAAIGATATLNTKLNAASVVVTIIAIMVGSLVLPWFFYFLAVHVDRWDIKRSDVEEVVTKARREVRKYFGAHPNG
jgi:hypothetical protein